MLPGLGAHEAVIARRAGRASPGSAHRAAWAFASVQESSIDRVFRARPREGIDNAMSTGDLQTLGDHGLTAARIRLSASDLAGGIDAITGRI